MRLRCPHCQSLGSIRSSETLSSTVTRHYLSCTNFECGHTWRATSAADMTLSPSATPDPLVNLPLSTHIRRALLALQISTNNLAPHVPQLTPPTTGDLFAPDGPS